MTRAARARQATTPGRLDRVHLCIHDECTNRQPTSERGVPLGLLRYVFASHYPAGPDFPWPGTLRPSYGVVIIGGGGHGLSTAYYLAKTFGITNVCVLERAYIGAGNT